jgi:hypothetical protein
LTGLGSTQDLGGARLDGVEGVNEHGVSIAVHLYHGSDLSWSAVCTSRPGKGTRPGSRSGSGMSPNSQGTEASSQGRWSSSVSAWRLAAKNRHFRGTPAAAAASNASAPNRSATNATSRGVVRLSSARRAVSAGTERAHSSEMRVSTAAPRGRSERSTGGREREVMVGGRDARNARCVAEAVDAKVTSVVVMPPWREDRRFASSANGIRWPIPGVASIATCGGRCSSPPFSFGRSS